ncbi:MAG: hypothetical protein BWK78_05430 [Thiotrichaceae bacterium IS1]|nr:MAG: hypothetical protein BWK78_05430 [Thiotrichaceae bacterium IS1]
MRILPLMTSLVFLLLVGCGQPQGSSNSNDGNSDGKITIRFSHVVRQNTPKGVGANMLKRLVNEHLGEKYRMEVYPDALLYEDDENMMKALEDGKIHLAAPSISKLIRCNPKLEIFDLPFLFEDTKAVWRFYENAKELLFKKDAKSGEVFLGSGEYEKYLVLALWHGGMKQLSAKLSANQSLKEPKDIQGLKFRVQKVFDDKNTENGSVLNIQFEALGITPVALDFKEVYKKLRDGKVNGQENIWSSNYSERYHHVQNHFIETNHGYLGYLLITSTAFWNGLDKTVREGLKKAIDEVTKEINGTEQKEGLAEELNDLARSQIVKESKEDKKLKGLEVVRSEEVNRDKWCKAVWEGEKQEEWKEVLKKMDAELLEKARKANSTQSVKEGCPFSSKVFKSIYKTQ